MMLHSSELMHAHMFEKNTSLSLSLPYSLSISTQGPSVCTSTPILKYGNKQFGRREAPVFDPSKGQMSKHCSQVFVLVTGTLC